MTHYHCCIHWIVLYSICISFILRYEYNQSTKLPPLILLSLFFSSSWMQPKFETLCDHYIDSASVQSFLPPPRFHFSLLRRKNKTFFSGNATTFIIYFYLLCTVRIRGMSHGCNCPHRTHTFHKNNTILYNKRHQARMVRTDWYSQSVYHPHF